LPQIEIIDHTTGLIHVTNPPVDGQSTQEGDIVHGLTQCVGILKLAFTDHQPAEHEHDWNDPVEPYGKPAPELMMSVLHGKKLWHFLKDQRRTVPEVLVVCCPTMDVALSIGYGICDQLHVDRRGTLYTLGMDPDETFEGDAPNLHVYGRVRECRALVC
jgi:hypothetical protein